MNSLKQSILVGLAFVAVLFVGSNSVPNRAHAAIVNGVEIEQYKVLDLNQLPLNRNTPTAALEVTLNAMAAEGWRVRTGNTNMIILGALSS